MHFCCRAPYGARGLKFYTVLQDHTAQGRAPYGARGLKLFDLQSGEPVQKSCPVWGAWIEISIELPCCAPPMVVPRMGRVD